jgi:hypothetical protein
MGYLLLQKLETKLNQIKEDGDLGLSNIFIGMVAAIVAHQLR